MESNINYWGFVIGIIGIILAIYSLIVQVRSNKKKEPVFSIKSNNLISGSASTLENLNISYKDYKVENLTVSKILFYNRGAETITGQDTETINRLSVSSETCKILDGSILLVNNRSNNIQVRYDPSNKNVFIEFDYLDRNQGAVIQVIHTGLSSDDLNINGDIKGVERLSQVPPKQLSANKPMSSNDKRFLGILAVLILLFWYSIIFPNSVFSSFLRSDNPIAELLAVVVVAVGGFGTIVLLLIGLVSVLNLFTPSYVIPKGLEQFGYE